MEEINYVGDLLKPHVQWGCSTILVNDHGELSTGDTLFQTNN